MGTPMFLSFWSFQTFFLQGVSTTQPLRVRRASVRRPPSWRHGAPIDAESVRLVVHQGEPKRGFFRQKRKEHHKGTQQECGRVLHPYGTRECLRILGLGSFLCFLCSGAPKSEPESLGTSVGEESMFPPTGMFRLCVFGPKSERQAPDSWDLQVWLVS